MNSSRLDIAYLVSRLSRYISNTGSLRSFNQSVEVSKIYQNIWITLYDYSPALEEYSDANWIFDNTTSKSTNGHVFTLGREDVYWKSTKQTCIPRSTMELEFIVLDKAIEEA